LEADTSFRLRSVTLLRQKALWLLTCVAISAKRVATGMILRRQNGYGGQDGVRGFLLRPASFGGQVAGFRKDPAFAARSFATAE